MTRSRTLAAAIAVAFIALLGAAASTPPASAQAALPYVAYGVGLQHGQRVEAVVGGGVIAHATADASGRWKLMIEAGSAANGDTVSFNVDGVATGKTVQFQGGRFPAPPGIALSASTATPKAATATATPTATPHATPRPAPKPTTGCTKAGKPVSCARAASKAKPNP
jgi:hypothetical protein